MRSSTAIVVGAGLGLAFVLFSRRAAASDGPGDTTGSDGASSDGGFFEDAYQAVEDIVTGPRGIRNNNPGNLRYSSSTVWQGLASPPQDRAGYCVFVSADKGLRAAAINLRNQQRYHGLNSVRGIISRYAPPTENNTEAYIAAVAKELGVDPGDTLNLNDVGTVSAFLAAIVRHENGKQPYSQKALDLAAQQAIAA